MKYQNLEQFYKGSELYIQDGNKQKPYYRYLVEQALGKEIPKGFTVHHANFNHQDNRLENLVILPTSLHVWVHRTKCTFLASNIEEFNYWSTKHD